MRKSMIAGLTLCTALAVLGGQALAADGKDGPSNGKDGKNDPSHHVRKTPPPSRVAETPTPNFRIPAHPEIRDCVHVMFPQCGRGYDNLNDGQFNTPYR